MRSPQTAYPILPGSPLHKLLVLTTQEIVKRQQRQTIESQRQQIIS